ncbi:CBO0543 family protein [Bacillus sp. JJ1764]|uniref:CBO0543 family protein n=1 Tax=Bacillus sp. JJ1764 TaxID=3122964 RepID=UPI002FFDCF76
MNFDRWIILGILVLSIISLKLLVPKEKVRDAWVIFLFLQVITWPAGLIAVEMDWIEYPIQLYPKANVYNRTSFSFEFFLFPVVTIIFSLFFPRNKKLLELMMYYLFFAGFFTVMEILLEANTRLVKYHEWKWYWTLGTVIISLYLNHKFYRWFRKRLIRVELK